MAKIFAPLLSIDAKKSVGKALTFQKRLSGTAVMGYKYPVKPPSGAQSIVRQVVKEGIEVWQSFAPDQKEVYNNYSYPTRMSGYHRFMHFYIPDHLPEIIAVATFLELTDTPATFDGQAGKILAIKNTEDGIEFVVGVIGTEASNEIPSGTIDGSNKEFTLAHYPSPAATLKIFLNGMFQTAGGEDYTLVDDTITFVNAPLSGSVLRAFYRY